MSLDFVAQLLFNGLIAGALYALMASGLSLSHNVAKHLHLAHGGVAALGAYVFYAFHATASLDLLSSAFLGVLAAVAAGWLINRLVYKPLRARKSSNAVLLIASFAVLLILNNAMQALFGTDTKLVDLGMRAFAFGPLRVTPLELVIFATTAVLLAALWYLMTRTKVGTAMRALADNKDVAQTVGINPERTYEITFVLASALAGVAGILAALELNLYPDVGTAWAISAFTGSVIGGMTSVPGSIVGGFTLGTIENLAIGWLPSGYKSAIAYTFLLLFLLVRPQGLFGRKEN